MFLEQRGQPDGVVRRPALRLDPVGGRHPEEEGGLLGDGRADGVGDLHGEPGAVLEGAPVAVLAVVGERGEELVQEVAVRRVDLQDPVAGLDGPAGGGDEAVDDAPDLLRAQFVRHRVTLVEGERARRDGLPAEAVGRQRGTAVECGVGAGLAAGVGELDARHHPVRVEEGGDPAVRPDLDVVPDAQVVGADAALGHHRGGLDEDQPGTADRPGAVVLQVPVGGGAGVGALRGRAVLAHRGHPGAVGKGDAPQGVRREETAGQGCCSSGRTHGYACFDRH